ncbi:MAG: thiamine pyrophosphate-requiring protein [Ahrensia sp.]|nr:thiamine pyrophosphate-requiring protein [Ahrensia sp.]
MNDAKDFITAGGAIFARLKALGIDYVFCNSGTDFPPIIEGLAEAAVRGEALPQALVIPHEHVAMGMAHGYWQATGKPQAVMLHTNVGLANGVIGAINSAHDNVPMLLMSGRTPVTEKGRFGSRTVPIGWGQEMRDQAALVRETSKWDYELRFADQIVELLDRALAIADSTPKGPTYLSLPREVLCDPIETSLLQAPPFMVSAKTSASHSDIETLADWIAEAKHPVLFSQRGTGTQVGFDTLAQLVEHWAIPVNSYWAQSPAIPTRHSMHVGSDPMPWVAEADLILCLDALAPWMPERHVPSVDARVVNIAPNPLFSRTPIRNFRSDLSLAGEVTETVIALAKALKNRTPDGAVVGERRRHIERASEAFFDQQSQKADDGSGTPMSKNWVSKCLSAAIERSGRKASITSELGAPLGPLSVHHFNGFRQEPHSGGLGYGLPAAMGIQLAEPNTLVFATMGDGSYIFANPTACHQVCEALKLPVITCVLNNGEWGAVRHSVRGLYPEGYAARSNIMPLTALQPSPDFSLVARASRAHTQTVANGADLPTAFDSAIQIATEEKRQVLLDIHISGDRA